MWIIRGATFWVLVLPPYVAAGGHATVLWQPFSLLLCLGIYGAYYFSFAGMRMPRQVPAFVLTQIGRSAIVPACVLPVLLSLIHTLEYLTAGPEKIGQLVAAALVAPLYGVFLYVTFFARYSWPAQATTTSQPQPPPDNNGYDPLPLTRKEAVQFVVNGMSLIGFLVVITFFVAAGEHFVKDFFEEDLPYRQWDIDREIENRAGAASDVYVTKNCKYWPREEREKFEKKIRPEIEKEFRERFGK